MNISPHDSGIDLPLVFTKMTEAWYLSIVCTRAVFVISNSFPIKMPFKHHVALLLIIFLFVFPSQQSKDCLRLDETMLVKQLLPEICHFIHTYREGHQHQHAAELRASASAVLFSLSSNNFSAVFSRISTR